MRCRPIPKAGSAVLEIGGQTLKSKFAKAPTELLFKGIELQQGDVNLQIYLKIPGKVLGPWQVDVFKT